MSLAYSLIVDNTIHSFGEVGGFLRDAHTCLGSNSQLDVPTMKGTSEDVKIEMGTSSQAFYNRLVKAEK